MFYIHYKQKTVAVTYHHWY